MASVKITSPVSFFGLHRRSIPTTPEKLNFLFRLNNSPAAPEDGNRLCERHRRLGTGARCVKDLRRNLWKRLTFAQNISFTEPRVGCRMPKGEGRA